MLKVLGLEEKEEMVVLWCKMMRQLSRKAKYKLSQPDRSPVRSPDWLTSSINYQQTRPGPSAYLETPEDWQDLHTGDELVSEEREILARLQWLAVALLALLVLLVSVEPGQQEVLPGPDDEAVHVQDVHHDGIPGTAVVTVTQLLRLLINFCSHRNNELQLQHAQRIFLTSAGKWSEIFSNLTVWLVIEGKIKS